MVPERNNGMRMKTGPAVFFGMDFWTLLREIRFARKANPARRGIGGKLILVFLVLFLFGRDVLARDLTGRVTWVYDGDTIKVDQGRGYVRVRVYGIDCPEKGQPYANVALKFVIERVKNHTVKVVEKDHDKYGRLVGSVILEDGTDLGRELVRSGLAWHYTRYSNDKKLAALEKEARQARRGLWRDPHPTPPWEYKKHSGGSRR